jgi:hypothetical protein
MHKSDECAGAVIQEPSDAGINILGCFRQNAFHRWVSISLYLSLPSISPSDIHCCPASLKRLPKSPSFLSDPATASYLLATSFHKEDCHFLREYNKHHVSSPIMISGESLNHNQLQWWNHTTGTEQADKAVMFCTCTQDALGSNLGWNTSCSNLRFSVAFLSHSRQMPG